MSVLIVGSTSVIGRAIAARLEARCVVKTAGRREADFHFDLSRWQELPAVSESFDVVVHVAADFGGEGDPDMVRAEVVNAAGTLSACALARQVGARHFVLMSSIFATYRAGDPYYGIYALSKRHGEDVARLHCAAGGMDLTILRPSQVYDDRGDCRRHQGLFYMMADRAQAGEEITLYGAHDARRNYIHLDDLAETVARVVDQRCIGEYACAHPRSVRLGEMAQAAFAAFDQDRQARFLPDKPALSDLPEIDDFALYDRIDFWPRIDVAQGYRRIRACREAGA